MYLTGDHDMDRLLRTHVTRRDLGMTIGQLETHHAVTSAYRKAHQIGEITRRFRRTQRGQRGFEAR